MATKPVFRKVTTAAESQKKNQEERANTARSSDKPVFRKVTTAWGGDLSAVKTPTQTQKPTVREPVRSNSATPSRQQWTATNGGRKSTTDAGKTNKSSAQKKSFFETATQNKAPGRVAGNTQPRQTSYAGQLGQVSRNAAAPNSRYDAENLRTAQKQEIATPSIGKDRSNQYSLRKGLESVVLKGGQQVAQAAGNTAALAEDLVLAPFELFSGQELGSLSDNAPFNTWARGIQREGQELQDKYAGNVAKGGKAAELLDRYGASTVAAVPQAVLAMLTSGGSMAASTAGLSSTAASELAPGVASTIRRSIAAAAKDPQYWLSFGQVVGDGYESALQDMQASGKYDNNTARTKAALYAIGNGILNAEVEVGGGIQKLPEELKHGAAAWKAWVDSMVDEGKEEVVQGIIERAMQNSVYDKGNPLASVSDPDAILNPRTAAEEFAGGAIVGGVLGAGQIGAQKVLESQYNRMAAQQGVQERADVQKGTRTTTAQANVQTQQEGAQRAIQEAAQRQTARNPISAEEQVLRQREAAVQKTFTGIADKLGDSGRKAFQTAYNGTDRVDYTGEFLRAYHAGMTNQENPNSTSAVSFAAYAAGQNDAAASLAREKRAAQFAKTAGTDSGLVFDDYVSREMDSAVADEVNTVSKALGVRTRMVDQVLGGSANGQITGSDVLIAKDAVDPALQVVGHEWTHRVQELAPEQYRSFRDAVASIPDVQEAAQILLEQYNRHGVETSYEQALDEATANYAGEMIANSDVLDDFIRKHSADRTLLQKLRDAIHEIVGKLTGRAKRQAQTVEGKLQAAFEAASKQAESLQNQQTNGTISETRYAAKGKYWRPNLTQKEWSLLNRRMEQEIADSTHTLDEATQWAYANEKGNQVFAIYGIGDGTEATPLYASGGKTASADYQAIMKYGEEFDYGADRSGEAFNRLFKTLRREQGQVNGGLSDAQRRGTENGHDRVSSERAGNDGRKGTGDGPQSGSEVNTRYSLKSVPAVQPESNDWRPGATFAEVKAAHPTLFELAADEADTRNPTQITGTVKSYRKIYDALEAEGFDGTILDASSGLGYGTRAGREEYGFRVDDIEPFPDSKYQPKYTDYSTLDKTYDVIISNAVLNVIPQDLRDAMVVKIGEMLNPGGRAFINVRGTDVKNAGSKVAINDDLMEYFISNTGSYQKGFTSRELVAYLKDALGDGFTVEPTKKFGAVSAIVTRDADGGKSRFSLKDYSDAEQRDHRKKAIAFFGKTYNWNETGYLTPAGTKLDFSGRHEGGPGGYRTVDHRDIRDAIGEDYGGDDYSGSMVQFMSEGNIRISPESGGINLSVEPTKSQMDALSDFIGKNRGEVILDLDTPDGQTVSSTEYPRGTHSSKVLNDIKAYFKDGTKPHVSELAQFLSLKGTENAQEIAALKRENENLKERVEYWKGQTRRSQGVTTDRKSVQKAADALVKDYGAEISGSDIAGDLQSLYDYIASGKDGKDELTYAEARKRSDAIAERIAESAVEVDDRAYKEYAGLRKYLKDTKLTLTEADAAEITDFNEFRKSLFGKLKISKGEHTNVDQIYSELSSQYPEFFNEAQETNISDQVQRIADVANRLYKVTEYNPFEGYMGQAVASISNDIMDRFFDLPQTKKTFADRAAEQVQEARFQGRQAANDAFLAGQMAQGKQDAKRLRSTAQALAKERTRRAEQVQALKERYREKDVTRRDNQKRRELRAKIVRHASALSQKLLRPTDNQHIPEDMRSAVAKVLESINQESSFNARSFTLDPVTGERIYKEPGTPTNRTVAFQNLKEQYQKIAQDGDMVVDPSLLGGDDVAGGFSEVIKMGDTRLADLTTEQLKTMWNVLKSVEHSVTTAGKTLASEKFATTKQFADALRMDGMTRRRKLGNNVAISLETPYTFFAHFGQTGKDIYRMLRNAQDHQEIMARDVAEKVHQILGDAKAGIRENAVTSMNEEVHHFTTTEGHELDLTTAQAMELYLLSERKQAEDHLLKGGIVQPEIKIPGKTKIPRGTDVIHLSAEDIQSIVKALTPEQIRIADGLQKLTTGVLANYGNEASMKAYGYKKFTEQDYWPIKSAKEALHSSQEKDSGNVRSIKNIGMAQAVKPNAATPLSIRGVFDTFADHASDMIDYAAWLCPMEDANRLYNFQFRDSEGNLVQTVKGFLEEKGGQGSQQYWQKLMGDIQNGIKTKDFEPLTDKFAKGIGSFKGAAVGANVRVVIQQPSAFFRASAVLDPSDMARGLTGGVTKGNGWEKALTHSPIAMRKDVGSFDISSPYTLNDRFYGKEGITNKINEKAGAPAGKADAVTWGALWNACEWQVKRERPNLRAGSGEFYSAVNEVFTNMIDQTQVVDGILQRSNIMRGKSDLAKQATSFMGEPIMSLNVFMRAWDNMRYEENPAKRSKAIKTVGRAAAALLVTDVVNALAQSIADAGRDDDPDKDYWEKFLTALTGITGGEKTTKELLQHIVLEGNLGSNVNKLGSIPFVKDILSLTQGYSVSRTDMQVFSDIVSASKDFTASMGGSGKKTREEALANMFAACSKLFGLPVANIKRDAMAAVRTAVQATGSVALEYEFEKFTYNIYSTANKSRYLNLAFKALEQGDLTTYEHIRKELKDFMALDNSSVDSSMRSKLDKEREDDEDFSLPDAAASLIGAKNRYGTGESESRFTENNLSSDDYIVYSRRKSELYSSMESGLEDSQVFRAFTDEQKDKALSSAETYAKKTALHETDKTYEITDKWILKAQEAQKKYGIKPEIYAALKTQVSDLESVKDRNGETIPNSKGLLIMQAVYNMPGLSEKQRNALFEYLGVGKSIRHYNKALVNEKVRKNARLAGK